MTIFKPQLYSENWPENTGKEDKLIGDRKLLVSLACGVMAVVAAPEPRCEVRYASQTSQSP
jgi:hypothetical protein